MRRLLVQLDATLTAWTLIVAAFCCRIRSLKIATFIVIIHLIGIWDLWDCNAIQVLCAVSQKVCQTKQNNGSSLSVRRNKHTLILCSPRVTT